MNRFNRADFGIVNITRRREAEMHLNKRYMTFTKSLLEDMGCPAYVQVLINAKNGEFALIACKASDEGAYRFSQSEGARKRARYCYTSSIKNAVITAMGKDWDAGKYYGFRGTYFPEDKAMVFKLHDFHMRDIGFASAQTGFKLQPRVNSLPEYRLNIRLQMPSPIIIMESHSAQKVDALEQEIQ